MQRESLHAILTNVLKTFSQSWLELFWHTGKHKRVPTQISKTLLRKLDMLKRATVLKDLSSPPSNHLHQLERRRKGQWAISVNGPWRLCFRFKDGDIFDIELTQYH